MVGAETASHLANHGKEVVIVEQLPELALDEQFVVRGFVIKELEDRNVRVYVNTTVHEIKSDAAVIVTNGVKAEIPADTVVTATGAQSDNSLALSLKDSSLKIVTIGDALEVRNAMEAVEEGYRAGLEV